MYLYGMLYHLDYCRIAEGTLNEMQERFLKERMRWGDNDPKLDLILSDIDLNRLLGGEANLDLITYAEMCEKLGESP